MRKSIIFFALMCSLTALVGCGGKASHSKYISEAHTAGSEAAEKVCEKASESDMVLESAILDAKVIQSKYMELDDTAAVNEFDRAFRSYIEQHNDTLAKKIF